MISIEVIEKLWAAATKAPWKLGPMKLYVFQEHPTKGDSMVGDAGPLGGGDIVERERDEDVLPEAAEACPKAGSMGVHSESFGDDGDGECAWCGARPVAGKLILRLRGVGSRQDLGANGAAIAAAPEHIAWLVAELKRVWAINVERNRENVALGVRVEKAEAERAAARPNPLQQVFDVACRYVDNGRDDADNVDGIDIADAVHAVRGNPDWRPRTEGVTPTVDELHQQLKDAKKLIEESAGEADLHAAEFMVVADAAAQLNESALNTLAVQAAQACRGVALGLRGEKWPEPAAEEGEGT